MLEIYKAKKQDMEALKSFANNQKYLSYSSRDLVVDDRHFIFYAKEENSIVGYIILVRAHPQNVKRKHTATIAVVVNPEKSLVVVPTLLERIYQTGIDLGVEKIHTYELSEKHHIINSLIKARFFQEAELKKMLFFDGEYHDVSIWSKFLE